MKLEEYRREINLMKKQNYTEYDMYSVIVSLMREGENIKKLSLRDVNRRQGRSKRGKVFYGLSSVPDFAILDFDFVNSENWINDVDKVFGCVEIKGINTTLLSIKEIVTKINNGNTISSDEGQLLGEILWYKKVLYTNGLTWTFLYWYKNEYSWKKIMDLVLERNGNEIKDETKEKRLSEWYNEINFESIKIKEELLITLSQNTTDYDWDEFIKKLYGIKWYK